MAAPARGDEVQPIPEEQLAALREEIRRAGNRTRWVRGWGVSLMLAGILVLAFLPVDGPNEVLSDPAITSGDPEHYVPYLMGVVFADTGILLMVTILIVIPVAMLFRNRKRKRLRTSLAALSPTQAAAVLLPLQKDRGDTRKIVRGLLRDLGLPTELTPAGTPAGSGAEVSAFAGDSATNSAARAS